MTNIDELKRIAHGIQKLFGEPCEVVIHDFADLEHSIVHIEGDVTGRCVGGAATDLLLMSVQNGNTGQDMNNYQTQTPNGRVLRSCTVFLRDEQGEVQGAFCINLDITLFQGFRRYLENMLQTDLPELSETFSDDIRSTIHTILMETIQEMGVAEHPILTREGKIELIGRLDEKGVFQVKKSVPILARELGLSRSTLYNYLSESRAERIAALASRSL